MTCQDRRVNNRRKPDKFPFIGSSFPPPLPTPKPKKNPWKWNYSECVQESKKVRCVALRETFNIKYSKLFLAHPSRSTSEDGKYNVSVWINGAKIKFYGWDQVNSSEYALGAMYFKEITSNAKLIISVVQDMVCALIKFCHC